MPFSINDAKELAESYQPLHLFDFTWADGSTLSVCTHPVTYGGTDYLPRVLSQQIDPIQALSPGGIDVPPSVKVTLADADKDLYAVEVARKFRGARLRVTFGYHDFESAEWSTDVVVPFLGRCAEPEVQDATLIVTAGHVLNLEAKLLPSFPIQPRCPKLFPVTAAQKDLAAVPGSLWYPCGVTDPLLVSCTFDQAGCDANANTLRFAGITYEVPPASRSREYTSGNWVTDLQSDPNDAKYGDYVPFGYGTAWVDCISLGVWPDANSVRGEAIVCEGRPESILKVVAADEDLPAATDLDGNPYIVADALLRYNVVSSGDRDGARTTDVPWNGAGDPHGSMCTIEWVLYRKGAGGGNVAVRALLRFPKVHAYAKIDDIVAGVVTLADNAPNADIAGNPPFTIRIFGNSNVDLNDDWGLTSWTYGPPGTVTLTGTTDSGTGGYIEYLASSDQYAWAILDVLRRAGLSVDDVELDWWIDAARKHAADVDFTARDGSASTHAKFTCSQVVRQRQTAAEILTGMLRGCNSHLGRDVDTGKVALFARGSIDEQQPAAQSGSNYGTAIGGGYAAYHFDESSMVRDSTRLTRVGRADGSVPNVVTIGFANEENDYSGDSATVADADDVNLMGQQIPGSLSVLGCNALDRANRIGAVYLAEQIEGERWRWSTSSKAIRLMVGKIVAVSNVTHDLDHQLMRVQSIAPSPNWETAEIEATVHDDAWYADGYQPVTGNAATGARRDRLARPSYPWAPYQVAPAAGDPLFGPTDWTFGLQLEYETLRNGTPQATALVTGKKPVNEPQVVQPPVLEAQGTTADSGGTVPGDGAVYFIAVASRVSGKPGPMSKPCQIVVAQAGSTNTITAAVTFWDPASSGYFVFVGKSASRLSSLNDAGYSGTPSTVTVADLVERTWGGPDTELDSIAIRPRLCWHAGVFGAAVSAVGTRTLQIAGAGWTTNEWAGYDCTLLAKLDLSELGFLNFRVASNTADTLTIDGSSPDPNALGVAAGDVITMLSLPSVSGLVVTDAKWMNTLSNSGLGLTAHEEKGRVFRVIAGPGRGFRYPIADNTTTTITVQGPWIVAPDSTSRYVIEDAAALTDGVYSQVESNDDPQAELEIAVPVPNYAGETVLLEAVTLDGGGNESAPNAGPVRLVYVPGSQGSRTVTA